MARLYENNKLVDMLLIYGEVRQNAAATFCLYTKRFPNRTHPYPKSYVRTVHRLRDTRKLTQSCGGEGGGRSRHILHAEEEVLGLLAIAKYSGFCKAGRCVCFYRLENIVGSAIILLPHTAGSDTTSRGFRCTFSLSSAAPA